LFKNKRRFFVMVRLLYDEPIPETTLETDKENSRATASPIPLFRPLHLPRLDFSRLRLPSSLNILVVAPRGSGSNLAAQLVRQLHAIRHYDVGGVVQHPVWGLDDENPFPAELTFGPSNEAMNRVADSLERQRQILAREELAGRTSRLIWLFCNVCYEPSVSDTPAYKAAVDRQRLISAVNGWDTVHCVQTISGCAPSTWSGVDYVFLSTSTYETQLNRFHSEWFLNHPTPGAEGALEALLSQISNRWTFLVCELSTGDLFYLTSDAPVSSVGIPIEL
jgi:hypothetical protein